MKMAIKDRKKGTRYLDPFALSGDGIWSSVPGRRRRAFNSMEYFASKVRL
jgi:hypothetical protein